jgi:type II secretion system protein J
MKQMRVAENSRSLRAFTIVEVLVAIGIFGMIMLAIYSSWSAILRGSRLGLTAAAEVQRTRVALQALEQSLGSAVMYADNPEYYSFFADTAGNYAFLSFVARLPESFPGSGLFAGQTVRRVTFQVDRDKNLTLSQSTLLDISDKPYTIKLAPNTRLFAVEFYNQRRNEWLPEWISTNQLPVMMRVALDFGDKADPNRAVPIRSIPLTATSFSRVGGARGARNISSPADDEDSFRWAPHFLPSDYGQNPGSGTPNPVFEGR